MVRNRFRAHEQLIGYGCFKPDNPRENPENGKPIKYESPLSANPELLAFNIPSEIWQKISDRYLVPMGDYQDFYKWLFDHPEIPLFLTEGAKKIGCLLTMGYAAVGLAGYTHLYQNDKQTGEQALHPDLKYFCNGKRVIYFAFDCDPDKKIKKAVHQTIRKTAGLILSLNSACKPLKVSWNGAKGCDDFVRLNGVSSFHTQVKRSKPIFSIAPGFESKRSNQPSRTNQKFEFIRQTFGSIRFNRCAGSPPLYRRLAEG